MRIVENELEDLNIWIIAGLLEYAYEELGCSAEEYLFKDWVELIAKLKTDENYHNGKHIGFCTNVRSSCVRCDIEMLVDEAKQLIEQRNNEISRE